MEEKRNLASHAFELGSKKVGMFSNGDGCTAATWKGEGFRELMKNPRVSGKACLDGEIIFKILKAYIEINSRKNEAF